MCFFHQKLDGQKIISCQSRKWWVNQPPDSRPDGKWLRASWFNPSNLHTGGGLVESYAFQAVEEPQRERDRPYLASALQAKKIDSTFFSPVLASCF